MLPQTDPIPRPSKGNEVVLVVAVDPWFIHPGMFDSRHIRTRLAPKVPGFEWWGGG